MTSFVDGLRMAMHWNKLWVERRWGEIDVDVAAQAVQISIKRGLPEIEIYCYLLVLIFLIDHKKYDEAKAHASACIARPKNLNRRTVDILASRLYSYYYYVHEGDIHPSVQAHPLRWGHQGSLFYLYHLEWFLTSCY